jgi:hypothetical protein
VTDLVMRLEQLPWKNDLPVHERSFLLLLDEIDIHLHPGWQRQIIPCVETEASMREPTPERRARRMAIVGGVIDGRAPDGSLIARLRAAAVPIAEARALIDASPGTLDGTVASALLLGRFLEPAATGALDHRAFEEAVELFDKVLLDAPNDAEARLYKARVMASLAHCSQVRWSLAPEERATSARARVQMLARTGGRVL